MTHEEKLAHFERELEKHGMWKSNAKPPMFWLLWKLGVEVPPPYFLSFPQAMLIAGAPFGLLMGLALGAALSFFLDGRSAFVIWSAIAFAAVSSGALFGVCMAFVWGWQRDKLQLPRWREYPPGELSAR